MPILVVTGGFGALGRAVAQAGLERGWTTALIDAATDVPAEFIGAPGVTCYKQVDLLDKAASARTFSDIRSQVGAIDALANIAGGFIWEPFEQADPASWQRMFDVNLLTAVSASRYALPMLRETRGSIINVGAFAALRAESGMGPYTASKTAVHRLTESLAAEMRASGVRVNAVLPSVIDTQANRRSMPDADTSRWVSPEALAQVILFLASPEARAVNGVLLPVTR